MFDLITLSFYKHGGLRFDYFPTWRMIPWDVTG